MKSLVTLSLFLFCFFLQGQENILKTESLVIDDFISFIVNNFPASSQDHLVSGTHKPQNLTFLIESGIGNFSIEDEIMLQQGFKILSSRLHNTDKLSIAVYSGQNGLLLNQESPIQLKKILHVLSHVPSNIIIPFKDGIGDTYALAQKNLNVNSTNTLIFLRSSAKEVPAIPLANSKSGHKLQSNNFVDVNAEDNVTNKRLDKPKNGSIVLLTAITLLPELIQIIKD